MRVTVVANGIDDIIDLINNFWGISLPTRVAPLLQARGYQVLSNDVTTSIDLGELIGNQTPYQIRLTLETGVSASSVAAITDLVRSVLQQATGYPPSAIAVTSAGQSAPDAPAGIIDRTIGAGGMLVNETVLGGRVIQVALVVGIVAVIYWVAKNPARAARVFA
jgi:hypothetical protein